MSVICDPAKERCVPVTIGLLLEHGQLLEDNVRLKAKLKECH